MPDSNWMTLFAVTLKFDTPWSIATSATLDDDVDIPVTRNLMDGKPLLPGASIIGSIRAAARGRLSEEQIKTLFGYVPLEDSKNTSEDTDNTSKDRGSKEKGSKDKIKSSLIEILGAKHEVKGETKSSVRARTAINPKTGAAQQHSLRKEEIVAPTSFRIIFQMRGHKNMASQNGINPFEEWFTILENWTPQLGRGRTVGLGRGHVERIEYVSANLNSDIGLKWWLFQKQDFFKTMGCLPHSLEGIFISGLIRPTNSDLKGTKTLEFTLRNQALAGVIEPEVCPRDETLSFKFTLRDPMHIGAVKSEAKTKVKSGKGELIKIYRQFGQPTISATTWKGVFRHRAHFIINAVGSSKTAKTVTDYLFGSCDTGRGIVWFRDSTFSGDTENQPPKISKREHVAIDRFSGGAKDSAKFTWECVEPGSRTTLVIDAPKLKDYPESKKILMHIVRDLHDGIIGVGAGVTRGYGRLTLMNIKDLAVEKIDLNKLKEEIKLFSKEAEEDGKEKR